MSFTKLSYFFKFTMGLYLLTITLSCCTQTRPFTNRKTTVELLSIHAGICPRIPLDMNKSKIVFFSDLHRGMGITDEFKKNTVLFEKILNHFFSQGYTLVLNGDIEEGWGYQRTNIPLIVDNYKKQIEIEKLFFKENRYFRIYGNHDDLYRGQYLYFDNSTFARVYPAIMFEQKLENGNSFTIFVTHGCQGHGFHDAGDDVAAWGVSLKYMWLLEFTTNKFRSDTQALNKMEKTRTEFEKHEKLLLEWAFADSLQKKCNILIGGHTHRTVFNSEFDQKMISILRKDYEDETIRIRANKGEPTETATELPFTGSEQTPINKLATYDQEIIEKLKKIESESPPPLRIPDKFKKDIELSPVYFNSGCGYISEMPCLEISEGHIRLTYIRLGESGELLFDTRREASLQKFNH